MATQDHDENENFVMHAESDDTDVNADQEEDYYLAEGSNLQKSKMLPWIVGAAVLVVLVFLFVVIFSRGDSTVDTALLKELEARITRMEEKYGAIEKLQDSLSRIEKQEKTLANLLVRFDNLESGVIKQMDQLKKELADSRTKAASAPSTKAGSPPAKKATAPAKATSSSAKPKKKAAAPKFHEVQAGETLYGISRSAGLTVDQLRSYNKLSPTDTIRPGQKLRLTPP